MADISTEFAGLSLKNPIIAGSSGFTGNGDSIEQLEEAGAAAVVLKSLFEEQIIMKARQDAAKGGVIYGYDTIDDYLGHYQREHDLKKYLGLIEEAKERVSIPIIPSINCISSGEWQAFTKELEKAGADALQLNMFINPFEPDITGETIEETYFTIISSVREETTLPLIVKIGPYFTNLYNMAMKLSKSGVQGLVLFNRFFRPDIDIKKRTVTGAMALSSPQVMSIPLRWISILHNRTQCGLTAATGIHDHEALIKMILAGADTVEIVSALYKHGLEQIRRILDGLESYMDEMGYSNLKEMRGVMSADHSERPYLYERVQYMKRYGEVE